MKKYINKLFEWLGYVPKDIENRYKNLMWKIRPTRLLSTQ